MRIFALAGVVAFAFQTHLVAAQSFHTAPCRSDDGGSSSWFGGHDGHACELRSTTLALRNGHLGVQGRNGGIEVIGEDRTDIALEAKVTAQAPSRGDAESLLHEVHIITEGSEIRAEGPKGGSGWFHGGGWSVDYKLRVPRRLAQADLRTSNGGIEVSDVSGGVNASSTNGAITMRQVHGDVQASSTNGPIRLQGAAGAVRAETTNGGVQITLAGDRWTGSGLTAQSTNGPISLEAPEHCAAHLVAETTNGDISVGFPVTVQGKIGRHLDTEVNGGGPTVRLTTTNGGVSIGKL